MGLNKWVVIVIGVLSNLVGCAFVPESIDVRYQKMAKVAVTPEAEGVTVSVQVQDQRQDKSKVSSKKNGWGMETAPITASSDVAETIRAGIEAELNTRGFQVQSSKAQVQVAANLMRFYSDHKLGFFSGDAIAEFNMLVAVKNSSGELLYTRLIGVQGVELNTFLLSGDNAGLALNRALDNGMKALFEDKAFLAALTSVGNSKSVSKIRVEL